MNTLAFSYVILAIRAYSGLAPVRQCSLPSIPKKVLRRERYLRRSTLLCVCFQLPGLNEQFNYFTTFMVLPDFILRINTPLSDIEQR